jgi:ribonuclease-3
MHPLETVLGYPFRDIGLLNQALTHASLGHEGQGGRRDNQRLEFLGDAVLQLTLSDALYARLPDADEGVLTKARARLVSAKALAQLGRHIGLGSMLAMGRGEEANGGRDRESSLADAVEAVAGAVFLDGGLDAARGVVLRLFADELETILAAPIETNPKGQLQELIQAVSCTSAVYKIVAERGADHSKTFEAAVSWLDTSLGTGTGKSKKDAETQAAQSALSNPKLQEMLKRQSTSSTPSPTV